MLTELNPLSSLTTHGMWYVPAPCSIALTIADVTRWYTLGVDVAVFSTVDI
jgi:hypothetical protein